MSKNGGYKIIDLGGAVVKVSTATKTKVPGIYEAIEETRKPILLSGLVVDVSDVLTEYGDVFISVAVSGTDFTFTFNGVVFTITDDDEIYYTAESTAKK